MLLRRKILRLYKGIADSALWANWLKAFLPNVAIDTSCKNPSPSTIIKAQSLLYGFRKN